MSRTIAEQIVDSVGTGSAPAIVAGTPVAAISNVTVTGIYADDDTNLETAINSILAALRQFNIVAT